MPSLPRVPARLLVAEDDATLRSLVATMLEEEGYEALQAADGEEALRLGMQHLHSLDLVLTDEHMPGMNGYELMRVLKSVRPDLKVIVMSGSGEIGAAVPGAAVLLKPFTVEELVRLIASQLSGAGNADTD